MDLTAENSFPNSFFLVRPHRTMELLELPFRLATSLPNIKEHFKIVSQQNQTRQPQWPKGQTLLKGCPLSLGRMTNPPGGNLSTYVCGDGNARAQTNVKRWLVNELRHSLITW